MTENLRKEFTAGEVLKPETTDVAENTTVQNPLNVISATTQAVSYNQVVQDADGTLMTWGSNSDVLTDTTPSAEIVNRWLSRTNGSATETNPSQADPNSRFNRTGEDQKFGVYYNWYTATAGTGTHSSMVEYIASGSICPTNWRLPGGTIENKEEPGSWTYLISNIYDIPVGKETALASRLWAFPLSIPESGIINWISGKTTTQGSQGRFWANAAAVTQGARHMTVLGTSTIYPSDSWAKNHGFTVRCLAK